MKPIIGKLYNLRKSIVRELRTLPEGTMLLVVAEVPSSVTFSNDYIVMHSGITERIPAVWHGWRVADEAG